MTELLPRHRYTEYKSSPGGFPVRFPDQTPEAVGLVPTVPPLRRTEGGAIDYEHYLRVARTERSEMALAIFRAIGRGLATLFSSAFSQRQRLSGPRHI